MNPVNLLSVSDVLKPTLYSAQVTRWCPPVDLILGCGDLPYYYIEFLSSALNAPVYFVRGNHDQRIEYGARTERRKPLGATDLHRRTAREGQLILAGVEGCLRYKPGPYQYTQAEMWSHVFSLVPALLLNRMRHGRYLDVFISHAPPWGINDALDYPHRGIKAFRWLLKRFRPRYHLHGHVHLYHPDTPTDTRYLATRVLNTYGHRSLSIPPFGQELASRPEPSPAPTADKIQSA